MMNGIDESIDLRRALPQAGLDFRPRDVRARQSLSLRRLFKLTALRQAVRASALVVLDVAAILLAMWTALEVRLLLNGRPDLVIPTDRVTDAAPLVCLVTVLLFARSGLYSHRRVRAGFRAVATALFQVMVVAFIFALLEDERFTSYFTFWGSYLVAVAYVSAARYGFDKLSTLVLAAAGYGRRALIVGSRGRVDVVSQALARDERGSLEPVGSIFVDEAADSPRAAEVMRELDARGDAVDELVVADTSLSDAETLNLMEGCHKRGVRVSVVATTMEIVRTRAELVPGQALPLLELRPPLLEGIDFRVKRAFDLLVASILVVVLSPVLLAIAVAIKLDSPGQILYRSMRPGMGGIPFPCFKFRTMVSNAERLQKELEEGDRQVLFKLADDPRITRVGRLLRRSSLDELPQLFNVLRAEMSLVGPRPLPFRDYDLMGKAHRRRYSVLPGITGLWQVTGRSDLGFDEMVSLDFFYIENWSVSMDLTILLRTLPAIVAMRGAY